MKKVDLAIIGGGGAAFAAAAKANELGVSAILFNKGLPLGGTCVNVGCVPSKFLLEAGQDHWRSVHPRFSSILKLSSNIDFAAVMEEKKQVVLRNRKAKYTDVLRHYKTVELIEERAVFDGPNRICAGNETVEAKYTLIATGASGKLPSLKGLESLSEGDLLNNISAFDLKKTATSMIVLGGGPTGLEVTQIFQRMGVTITLVESKDRVFTITEAEISEVIAKNLQEDGVEVILGARAVEVRKENGMIVLSLESNGTKSEVRAEKLFTAVGLKGNTEDLNLKSIGLVSDKNGFIEIDEQMKTKADGIFAAGDVTGPPWLETVAAREGSMAVAIAFGKETKAINYDAIPAAVFIEPQVAIVGITEEESMRRYGKCSCRTVPLKFVPKADITNQTNGVAKMVIHPESKKILGFHLVSPNAAEIIHEAALAIQHGLTVADIVDMVHVFPSYSEVVKLTAQAFTRDISQMSCCVE